MISRTNVVVKQKLDYLVVVSVDFVASSLGLFAALVKRDPDLVDGPDPIHQRMGMDATNFLR